MKKLLAILIIIIFAISLTSCNNKKEITMKNKNEHTIYIRESYSDKITAIFTNTNNDDKKEVEVEKIENGNEYNTYSCSADTEKYDRVMFIGDNTDKSINLTFNKFVNGYHLQPGSSLGNIGIPFVYDNEEAEPKYETISLKYNDKKDKKVFIWTPENYNKDNNYEKYSVIYMCDGQNLFDKNATDKGCWNVAESVNSMIKNSDNKCIIVGIDNGDGNRDNELTPNIGTVRQDQRHLGDFENGTGKEFSDFIINTVMPYINRNYNTYTDKSHNAICGSSSGGLEAFYIGMEHNDKFSSIGALSPAFILFGEDDWDNYLKEISFKNDYPLIYIFNGDGDELESALMVDAKKMVEYLAKIDYPKDKIIFKEYKQAEHNEHFWRSVFPEYLYYTYK